jgi:hypothetical protein
MARCKICGLTEFDVPCDRSMVPVDLNELPTDLDPSIMRKGMYTVDLDCGEVIQFKTIGERNKYIDIYKFRVMPEMEVKKDPSWWIVLRVASVIKRLPSKEEAEQYLTDCRDAEYFGRHAVMPQGRRWGVVSERGRMVVFSNKTEAYKNAQRVNRIFDDGNAFDPAIDWRAVEGSTALIGQRVDKSYDHFGLWFVKIVEKPVVIMAFADEHEARNTVGEYIKL